MYAHYKNSYYFAVLFFYIIISMTFSGLEYNLENFKDHGNPQSLTERLKAVDSIIQIREIWDTKYL